VNSSSYRKEKEKITKKTTTTKEEEVDLIKEELQEEGTNPIDGLTDILTFLCQSYQSILGCQFNPTAKDKQALKDLLAQFPIDSVKTVISQALKDVKDRVTGLDRFSIGLVKYRLEHPQFNPSSVTAITEEEQSSLVKKEQWMIDKDAKEQEEKKRYELNKNQAWWSLFKGVRDDDSLSIEQKKAEINRLVGHGMPARFLSESLESKGR
jgi:hypothetical protein